MTGGAPETSTATVPRSATGAVRRGHRAAHRATLLERSLRHLSAARARRPGHARTSSLVDRASAVLLHHERAAALVVALLLLVASLTASLPAAASSGSGALGGSRSDLRLVVGGGLLDSGTEPAADDGSGSIEGFAGYDPSQGSDGEGPTAPDGASVIADDTSGFDTGQGSFLETGELLKPVAVDTSVDDARERLRTYEVRPGDTLSSIARRFGVSLQTIWWANSLKSKDEVKVGMTLVIPPVSGLVITARAGETLRSVASRTSATVDDILAFNGLTDLDPDQALDEGQVLIIPGGRGAPLPSATPKPTKAPQQARTASRPSRSVSRPPATYSGGSFAWPVPGGYVSQYFHYGHYAIDIAADYGTPVRAAARGTVIFAGWKGNGGGWQVWIAHGSGLYTTYNHMSSLSVRTGEHVGRGEQVGRVGQSGWASGPHCHFEVWRGPIWNGGTRVNPMAFF